MKGMGSGAAASGYSKPPLATWTLSASKPSAERVEMHTIGKVSRTSIPRHPAIVYCQGTPFRNEFEAGGCQWISVTDSASDDLEHKSGSGLLSVKIRSLVITAKKVNVPDVNFSSKEAIEPAPGGLYWTLTALKMSGAKLAFFSYSHKFTSLTLDCSGCFITAIKGRLYDV